ncbi:MAG: Rieske 2Fe-2S domain-containing protein [Cellvibrionaceae bacterium]|nr:Rieske 2Fe-2S domain-containing protein [Cellvibrionaceae bacterium]MCV6625053.1 Rieske 2Fe-2S domain-containing protein [Cellvibrionaceae bacterium]
MAFYPLSKLHRLVDGLRECHRVAGRDILLLQVDGYTHLLDARCPHAGQSLVNGSCDGQSLRCPAHGLAFDLRSDRCIEQPHFTLKRYLPVYHGDTLGVEL